MKQQLIIDWPQLLTALATLIGAITAGIVAVLAALKRDNSKQADQIVTAMTTRQDALEKRLDSVEEAAKQRGKHISQAVAVVDQKVTEVQAAVNPAASRP